MDKTISSFRRRQKLAPIIMMVVILLLVFIGVSLIWQSISGSGFAITLFATDTPTPTLTFTPTTTFTPSATPSETPSPTITMTPTPSAPFEYIVQDGDFLASIAEKFVLGEDGIQLMILLNPSIDPLLQIIVPGQRLLIPNPDMQLPTATPIPSDLPRGTKITYTVEPGDSLEAIAIKFNSTVAAIIAIADNNLTDAAAVIFAGQPIIVPVNLVTPVPTETATPSETPTPSPTP